MRKYLNLNWEFLKEIRIKNADHNIANKIEWEKPLCPSGSSYGIPIIKLTTSKSGRKEDVSDQKYNFFWDSFIEESLTMVVPANRCPKIEAI